MAKLPRTIIKKYGITKKAWSVFRNTKRSTSRSPSRSITRRNTRRVKVNTVARRRGFKRTARRAASRGSVSPGKLAMYSFGYGLLRQPISQLAQQVPMVGGFGDEVVLGVAGYLAATKGSGMIKDFGRAMLTAEAYGLGRQASAGGLSLLGGNTPTVMSSANGATFQ